jgi:hypothetical protein
MGVDDASNVGSTAAFLSKQGILRDMTPTISILFDAKYLFAFYIAGYATLKVLESMLAGQDPKITVLSDAPRRARIVQRLVFTGVAVFLTLALEILILNTLTGQCGRGCTRVLPVLLSSLSSGVLAVYWGYVAFGRYKKTS